MPGATSHVEQMGPCPFKALEEPSFNDAKLTRLGLRTAELTSKQVSGRTNQDEVHPPCEAGGHLAGPY